MRPRKYNSHGPTSFLKNTYEILCSGTLDNIIHWSDTGESFVIRDLYNFTNTVLPKYFKHSNLASFIRQLNMYGFHKVKEDSEGIQFSHPMFQRNKKNLLKEIHRKSTESLNKEEEAGLTKRLKKFKSQQQEMGILLENLESQYSKVLEQNQVLLSELLQSKQREKQVEQFLQNFTQRTKVEVQNKKPCEDYDEIWNIEPRYPETEMFGEDLEKEEEGEEFKYDYSHD